MATPTDPLADWASNPNHAAGTDPWSGQPNKVDPGPGGVASGFTPGDKPPAEWFNWVLNNHGQHIQCISDRYDTVNNLFQYDPGVVKSFSLKVPGSSMVPSRPADWRTKATFTSLGGGNFIMGTTGILETDPNSPNAGGLRGASLDLSAYLPEGATLVSVSAAANGTLSDLTFALQKNGTVLDQQTGVGGFILNAGLPQTVLGSDLYLVTAAGSVATGGGTGDFEITELNINFTMTGPAVY